MSIFSRFAEYYSDPEYFREVRRIALPIIAGQVMFSLMNVLGVVFVGQKGETAVAAVALAGQIAFLLNLVHFGIISGAAMFTAQFWGKRDLPNLRRVLGLSLILAVSAAGVFLLVAQVAPHWFLTIYSKDPAVIALGVGYMRIYSWSFLLTAVTTSFSLVMRSTGDVRIPVYISTTALAFNTLLSWSLIFGHLGLPELSINGAAVAMVISRSLELTALLTVVYWRRSPVAASLRELLDFDLTFVKRVIVPMYPVMLNELFWALGITTYSAIYGRMGTASIAAVNIIGSLEQMAFVLFIGISNATSVLVGNRIGAGKEDEAFLYAGRSILLCAIGGMLMGVLLQLLKVPILSLYKVAPEVIVNAGYVLNVVCLFLWVRVNNMTIIVGTLRAGGDTRYSLFLDGIIIWLLGVPLAAFGAFVLHLPVWWVVVCAMSEEVTKWYLGVRRYRSRKWINNLAHA